MTAPNPLKGEATLVAGEETLTLAFDISALIVAEEATGWDTPALVEHLSRGGLKAVRGLLWGGLQRYHECPLARATEIMAAAGILATREAIQRGIAAAFPAASAEDKANPPTAADGTGSAS